MSDVVYQALIAAVVTIILAWMQHRAKLAADRAAVKVEQVKVALEGSEAKLDKKLDGLTTVSEAVHKAVNSTAKALADQKIKDDAERKRQAEEIAALKAEVKDKS